MWKTEKLQHLDDEVLIVVDNENKEWKGHILNIVDLLNELNDERMMYKTAIDKRIVELQEENEQLKRRLEKINGGYGHLTHRKGLTANEWLIQSQEKELKKKDDRISEWIAQHGKDIAKISEQNKLIQNLKEENDKLKELIKGNVFGKYREGSLADLKFKAIAYDDIVKLEMSYESEPKVIVSCKQGKKKNVISFCQMFIPFGVYYEIKEVRVGE